MFNALFNARSWQKEVFFKHSTVFGSFQVRRIYHYGKTIFTSAGQNSHRGRCSSTVDKLVSKITNETAVPIGTKTWIY